MKYILSLLILVSQSAFAATIVTTSKAITDMAELLAYGTDFEVKQLSHGSGCPHHRHLRPSALGMIEYAAIVVYTQQDEAYKAIERSSAAKLKLEDITGLRLIPGNGHMWLDPQNARLILRALARLMGGGDRIEKNLIHALTQLEQIELLLRDTKQPVTLLHADLAYLASVFDNEARIVELRQPVSAKKLLEVEQLSGTLVVNTSALYKHFDKRAILIDPDLSLWQLIK